MRIPLFLSLSLAIALTGAEAQTPKAFESDLTLLTNGLASSPDGIAKARDQILYIKHGQVTRVNNELKLSEGIVARPNGEVVLRDGKTITLQEGQMVTLDGKLTTAPVGLGSTAPGSVDTPPTEGGDKAKFGNTGVRK